MARRKSFLERMLGGDTQQAQELRERENRSIEAHVLRQAKLRDDLERFRAERDQPPIPQATPRPEPHPTRLDADLRDQNECLRFHLHRLADVLRDRELGLSNTPDVLAAAFRHGGADAFTRAVQDDLSASPYPLSVPTRTTVPAYRPDTRELTLERELPRDTVIPPEQEYRIDQGRIVPMPRKAAEVSHLYRDLLARVALRTLAEAFALTPPALVDRVVLNGRVTALDKATGRTIHPILISVQLGRKALEEIDLDAAELDPELCLRQHGAQIWPHPYEPDHRIDLLTLQAREFESLVRQLFEARGLKAWRTQASRDDAVDAVAVNEDPILGGVAVIQARHDSRVVPADAIRSLAGAMVHLRAAKGILVTTSWVGRESLEFARRNGRIHIIEGRELKQMLAESLNLDVLISLPTLPQGWARAQVA